jgi:hypothetical protein
VGDLVAFRPAHRPLDPETADDYRDEVTALEAERAELVAAMRPVIARLAIYGATKSPAVLAQAQQLAALIERPARRTLGGAA